MAVQAAPGVTSTPPLTWWAAPCNWKSQHLFDFLLHALPAANRRPRVVGLDHPHGRANPKGRGTLEAQDIELRYLPSHGPELNDIERTFRRAKHEAMPRRMQPRQRALMAAVHACFRELRDELESLYLSMRSA